MRVVFDGRFLKNLKSGLGRYSQCLLIELLQLKEVEKVILILDINSSYQLEFLEPFKGKHLELIYTNAPLFSLLKNNSVSDLVNSINPDLYFYPHFNVPLSVRVKTCFVVHDSYPKKISFSEQDESVIGSLIFKLKKMRFLRGYFFTSSIRKAFDKNNMTCICVSNSTKKDVIELVGVGFSEKVKVVFEASFDSVLDMSKQCKSHFNLMDKRYLLYVGDRRPHKNLKKMIDIFNVINKKNNLSFIIAGSSKVHDFDYEHYIQKHSIKNINFLGPVCDEELVNLYENAEALFFLSKHEGFGLPLLEAAKYNTRVITSNTSSLPEFAPPGSLLMSPYESPRIAAELIEEFLTSTPVSSEFFIQNFTWRKAAVEIFLKKSNYA